MGIGGQTITECSICGGTAGSTAGHAAWECVPNLRSRLDDAEAVLKSIGCPGCGGTGGYNGRCPTCKGSGLHPDATLFFERWK